MPAETLPIVPVGHAELRVDNSAATIDGVSDRAKGAHSLPNREFDHTCVFEKQHLATRNYGTFSFNALWPTTTRETNLLLDRSMVSFNKECTLLYLTIFIIKIIISSATKS